MALQPVGVFHSAGIKKVLLSILLAVFGTFGTWLIVRGLGDVSEAAESSGWPTTPGTVLSAEVHTQTSSARHSNSTSYAPVISYSYAVNGENFVGTAITPGRMWGSSSAYAAVRRFSAGSHPAVYYSPAQPGQAVLIPGLHFYNFAPFLCGLLAFTFPAVFGVFSVLGPREGVPDGRGGYDFPSGSPASRDFLFFFIVLALEFGLVWWAAVS